MSSYNTSHYKHNYSRYQHYYRQIWRFYQKPTAKVSTALLLTIFTIIFFAIFAIRPTLVTIAELLKTIHDREEVLVKLERKSASLASAQQEYLIASEAIDQLDVALPPDQAVQELITMIEATAAHHQLVINSLNLSEFEYSDNPPTSSEDLLEIPFSLSISGQYQDLEEFVANIIKMPRFTKLDSLSLGVANTLSSSNVDDSSLDLNLRLTAYYQPEE